jgi:hypothetical protein
MVFPDPILFESPAGEMRCSEGNLNGQSDAARITRIGELPHFEKMPHPDMTTGTSPVDRSRCRARRTLAELAGLNLPGIGRLVAISGKRVWKSFSWSLARREHSRAEFLWAGAMPQRRDTLGPLVDIAPAWAETAERLRRQRLDTRSSRSWAIWPADRPRS